MERCTCGSEGIHGHELDGSYLWLCGHCHAAFKLLMKNHMGMNVVSAIRMSGLGDEASALDMFAAEDPSEYTPHHRINSAPQQTVVVIDPMYEPIPLNFNEVYREPPEFDYDEEGVCAEDAGVVSGPA